MDLRYDVIMKYIDENASNFNQYHLLISPVPPPSTTVTVGATKYTMMYMIDWTHSHVTYIRGNKTSININTTNEKPGSLLHFKILSLIAV